MYLEQSLQNALASLESSSSASFPLSLSEAWSADASAASNRSWEDDGRLGRVGGAATAPSNGDVLSSPGHMWELRRFGEYVHGEGRGGRDDVKGCCRRRRRRGQEW